MLLQRLQAPTRNVYLITYTSPESKRHNTLQACMAFLQINSYNRMTQQYSSMLAIGSAMVLLKMLNDWLSTTVINVRYTVTSKHSLQCASPPGHHRSCRHSCRLPALILCIHQKKMKTTHFFLKTDLRQTENENSVIITTPVLTAVVQIKIQYQLLVGSPLSISEKIP